MKDILLLMMCSQLHLFSQSIEPSAATFNWGSHTGTFNDTQHAQTKVVLGWEWAAQDTAFNKYMLANTFHDKNLPKSTAVASGIYSVVLIGSGAEANYKSSCRFVVSR